MQRSQRNEASSSSPTCTFGYSRTCSVTVRLFLLPAAEPSARFRRGYISSLPSSAQLFASRGQSTLRCSARSLARFVCTCARRGPLPEWGGVSAACVEKCIGRSGYEHDLMMSVISTLMCMRPARGALSNNCREQSISQRLPARACLSCGRVQKRGLSRDPGWTKIGLVRCSSRGAPDRELT